MTNGFYNSDDFERYGSPQRPAAADEHRTPFQIDRDRVVFSFAFRRLQSKTQVFQAGEYDFYRTRLTHSLEVARIARSICDHLRGMPQSPLADDFYIDSDLVEAIGLSHDLGHPPFGHIGERKLNDLMRDYGGFEGNAQTLRILTQLMWDHPEGPEGMHPTRAFLDGVLKYKALFTECYLQQDWQQPENHFLYDEQRAERQFVFYGQPEPVELRNVKLMNRFRSLECQVMDWADDTAYCLHDIVDGAKAGFLTASRIEAWAATQKNSEELAPWVERLLERLRKGRLEQSFASRVGKFIKSCRLAPSENFLLETTRRYAWRLEISEEAQQEASFYKRLARDLIFRSTLLQQLEYKGGQLLEDLFKAIAENYLRPVARPLRILPVNVERGLREAPDEAACARLICDFLAGCTDGHAIRLHKRLFQPDYGSITDLA